LFRPGGPENTKKRRQLMTDKKVLYQTKLPGGKKISMKISPTDLEEFRKLKLALEEASSVVDKQAISAKIAKFVEEL
jgi:hypothetical protein